MTYKVHANQSIFDVACHVFGNDEAAFEIALLNNKGVTDSLVAGEELKLPDFEINYLVKNSLSEREEIPATAKSIAEGNTLNYLLPQIFPII